MSAAYRAGIQEQFPQAGLTIDKCHLVQAARPRMYMSTGELDFAPTRVEIAKGGIGGC
jgi:Transposase